MPPVQHAEKAAERRITFLHRRHDRLAWLEADLAGTRHVATLEKPFSIDELIRTIEHLLGEGP